MTRKRKISTRIIQSEIRSMSIECAKVNGINLAQGFSDTDLQPFISTAAKAAIDQGYNHYTRYNGISALRNAIAVKLASYNHINADPEKNIIVTSGATAGLFCALYALCQPQDEIIVFEPYYGYHLNTIFALNLTPKYCRLSPPNWSIDFVKLQKLVTKKTKAIIVNTPTNPSGKVFTKQELIDLCRLAKKNNIYIITDEIYEYFLYDDSVHISPASLTGFSKNVITISGYSKTFSITGWRIGYVVCPAELSQVIGYIHDLYYVCAPAPLQAGVVAGIEKLDISFYKTLKESYQTKRDLICEALDSAGLPPVIPNGAYYVLADISQIKGSTSKQKVMKLLKDTGIAAVPGEAFYHDDAGKNVARFCFAKRDEVLEKAVKILKRITY